MNISQIRSMTRAIAKAFSFYANDYVSYTSPAGVTTTNIRCFLHHPARVSQDSITVDAAGTRYYEELEVFFLLEDLGTIVIDPAGHFDIDGTRYSIKIFDSFDYKSAEKYYSIEVGYIIDDYTDLSYMDEGIDKHMKNYKAIWTASDCGPFRFNRTPAWRQFDKRTARCNNYSIYDINLNLNEFDIFYFIYLAISSVLFPWINVTRHVCK